jgi:tetratricopeptide (TPR) repeat protein
MSVTPDGNYFFFLSDRPTELDKGEKVTYVEAARYSDTDVYWIDTGFIEDVKQNVLHKECAAEAVRKAYRDEGVQPAIDKLAELHSDPRDNHYFELSEFLMLCGEMTAAGDTRDAEQLYQALLEMLPDTFRIRQGYAVANILNGQAVKGLDLMKDLWVQNPSVKSVGAIEFLTYHLSSYSKTDDELLVLEFCTDVFPDSHKAFFNLAQTHARLGNREEALRACCKSLELKPGFTGAVELLEELQH